MDTYAGWLCIAGEIKNKYATFHYGLVYYFRSGPPREIREYFKKTNLFIEVKP